MQEIFVLDDDEDDEAPPSRPLAVELQNGSRRDAASSLAKLNGTSSTKGKRKAQPSPPSQAVAGPVPSSFSTTTTTTVHDANNARKRRREAQPQSASGLASTASHYGYPAVISNSAATAATATDYGAPSHWTNVSTSAAYPSVPDWSTQLQQQQQSHPGGSYRGGYAAGIAAVAPSVASTNGHTSLPNRQNILDAAESAQKRFVSSSVRMRHVRANVVLVLTVTPSSSKTYDRQYQQPSYRSDVPPPPQPVAPQPVDDKDGHYIVREGEWISDPRGGEQRYKILSQLGQGTFGKVVECYDRQMKRYVAIKVIRAIQKYRDASQIEIRVLKTLSENDPHNENKCIHLLDTFSYRNHVCIVSELLGKSVFDFLKDNQFNPFPPAHIWSFAQQLLKSVAFLHRLNLVHTDLKPENILLVSSDYDWQPVSRRANSRRKRVLKDTDIRLIDFGSATFNDEYHSQVVSTRHYRAPEIILNMGWSFPCDAWSIGCILIEFYTGEALFQTHDNLEHLAMMEQVLGPMPDGFRRKAETFKADYFRSGRLDFPNAETPKGSKKYVAGMRKLSDILSKATTWKKHNDRFLHLLRRLLDFDPTRRIGVSEALHHPYFELTPSEIPP